MMDMKKFWRLVDTAACEDIAHRTEKIEALLMTYSAEEVQEFNHILQTLIQAASQITAIFDAFAMIHDNSYHHDDFIACLVSAGKEAYLKVTKKPTPQTIGHYYGGETGLEEYAYVPSSVYEKKTGNSLIEYREPYHLPYTWLSSVAQLY